jgi:hypothetical protein
MISEQVDVFFWAADYRGIVLTSSLKGYSIIVFEREKIRDQEWFTEYLNNLDFIEKHVTYVNVNDEEGNLLLDSNGDPLLEEVVVVDNVEVKIEDGLNLYEVTGLLYDTSEVNDTLVLDKNKIPYYRPFALALKEVTSYNKDIPLTGIGLSVLDIAGVDLSYVVRVNPINISEDIKEFTEDQLAICDLSFSEFDYSKIRPRSFDNCEGDITPIVDYYNCSTYAPGSSSGISFSSGYIDNSVFEWRPSGGYLDSMWLFSSPYYCGAFTKKTRIHVEFMGGDSINHWSWIYASSVPVSPDTISLDNNTFNDSSFITFREENIHNASVYHKFEDGVFDQTRKLTSIDDTNSSLPSVYNYEENRWIGYNRMMGDAPSYSSGSLVENAKSAICYDSNGIDKDSVYKVLDFLEGDYGLNWDDEPPTLNINSNILVKEIRILYKLKTSDAISETDKEVSFDFGSSSGVIDRIRMPVEYASITETLKEPFLSRTINCKYYWSEEQTLRLHGKFWDYIDIEEFYAVVIDTTDTSINDFNQYKADGGQTSIIVDGGGRLLLFYEDEFYGNISVMISPDNGREWVKHENLIWLLEGETASLPYAIKDPQTYSIHLFYLLNDSFIMYKDIPSDMFECADLFKTYVPPYAYDSSSEDQLGLEIYSESGKLIRNSPSYFVAGNKEENFYQDQMEITQDLKEKNYFYRFDFVGDESELDEDFFGDAFTVYVDNSGTKRLIYTSFNKVYIKTSGDFKSWRYQVKGIQLHKNFLTEELDEGDDVEIKNIQVLRNYDDNDTLSLLYFSNGMLLMRNFHSNTLGATGIIPPGSIGIDEVVKELELTENSKNKPIFLVGQIPDDIKDHWGQPELSIQSNYPEGSENKFNHEYALDDDTQVGTYAMAGGLSRIFYKDSIGNLRAILLNGRELPMPELWLEIPSI